MADAVAPPSVNPLHDAFESTTVAAVRITGSVIVFELVFVHPFASVTVTVKVPAPIPVIVAVVAELLHA